MAVRYCRECRFFESGYCSLRKSRTGPTNTCSNFVEYRR